MTRVNPGIDPGELSDAHLLAEWREIPRVIGLAARALEREGLPLRVPAAFTLGTGHVRFFYPRTRYIARRHAALTEELLRRGYQLRDTRPLNDHS